MDVSHNDFDTINSKSHSCFSHNNNYHQSLKKWAETIFLFKKRRTEIYRTEYESECWTKQEVHDVEDDVVECRTEVEEKCEDETSGYTTNTKCSKWPREVCSVSKKQVKKYTP